MQNINKHEESQNKNTSPMMVGDIIDWGQGYDEDIIKILQSFKKLRSAYYELENYGNWWEVFNQDVWFNEIVSKEWGEIEQADFVDHIEKITKAITGSYIMFDKLVQGIETAYNSGKGLRHTEKPTGIWTLEYGGTNIYPILGITCSNCHYHTEIHTDADHFDNDIPKVCPQCSSKNIYKK
jgi:hypothetical protein